MKKLLGVIGILLAIASSSVKSIEADDIYFNDHYKFRLIIAPSFETVTVYQLIDVLDIPYLLKYQYPNTRELLKENPTEVFEAEHTISAAEYKCLLNMLDAILNEIDLSANNEHSTGGYTWVLESNFKFGTKISLRNPRIKAEERGLTHLIELKEMLDQKFSAGSLNCSIKPAVEA